jgi:hypothetical protein
MPSLIVHGADGIDDFYMLPPIRYPDGKIYMKIGGDPDDVRLGRSRSCGPGSGRMGGRACSSI